MNAPDRDNTARELARGLGDALEPILGERANPLALRAARDVAQLLGLSGLERLLGALEPCAGHAWPPEVSAALERLRRERSRCDAEGDVVVFRRVDSELRGIAAEVQAIEWSRAPESESSDAQVRTLSLSSALADLAYELRTSDERARDARLTAPVAAALRAALDWLAGEFGPRRPFAVSSGDGVLEVAVAVGDGSGFAAAHEVLAAAGGQCGPWLMEPPEPGLWQVRVPLASARDLYLMVEQGGLNLALPWGSVLRFAMLKAGDLDERVRAMGPDVRLIAPLDPTARGVNERPAIVIASGLKRGVMIADRLVWRLAAVTCDPARPAPAGFEHAVRGEDGAVYWIANPARLLSAIPLPQVAADPPRRGRERIPQRFPAPPSLRVLSIADVTTLPVAPRTAGAVAHASRVRAPEGPASEGSAPAPHSPRVPAPEVHVPGQVHDPAPTATRRALVIEDSITARMFLTRMLQARGLDVVTVTSAADALHELAHGPWVLVCIDVELPDARGSDWLRSVQQRAGAGPVFAALVRDRPDREAAHAAGISRMLRKPFDEAEVAALISRIGPGGSGNA
ncbi:MAG: response regulator [Candidatus Eisenbacteria bacterium]|nr:response regulator [Candidatus Eisenbacteria bacterium]